MSVPARGTRTLGVPGNSTWAKASVCVAVTCSSSRSGQALPWAPVAPGSSYVEVQSLGPRSSLCRVHDSSSSRGATISKSFVWAFQKSNQRVTRHR